MGAWGFGSFDNDDAADFVYDFEESGVDAVRDALTVAAEADDYLDAPEASLAVAAAEFICAANGDAKGLSESAQEALDKFGGDRAALAQLKALAARAVARVLAPESELIELWTEDGVDAADRDGALSNLKELQVRVA